MPVPASSPSALSVRLPCSTYLPTLPLFHTLGCPRALPLQEELGRAQSPYTLIGEPQCTKAFAMDLDNDHHVVHCGMNFTSSLPRPHLRV